VLPNNRQEFREFFQNVFTKIQESRPLTPLESQVAEVIHDHPEYHELLSSKDSLGEEYHPERGETNPFLHLALHLSIRDQIRLNRPEGSLHIFEEHCRMTQDRHQTEHMFLDVLGEVLHEASRSGQSPDEKSYIQKLRSQCGRTRIRT
jgi:hypothetical protein